MFVSLRCVDCDNSECKTARRFIPEDSLEGCTRDVSEEQGERLYYYMNEVLPFIKMNDDSTYVRDTCNEISSFLDSIYSQPIGARLDAKGKSTTRNSGSRSVGAQ